MDARDEPIVTNPFNLLSVCNEDEFLTNDMLRRFMPDEDDR